MSDIDPGNACAAFSESELVELLAIAQIHERASGPLLRLTSEAGKRADQVIDWLPDNWEAKLDGVVDMALRQAYAVAFRSNFKKARSGELPNREGFHRFAAGAVGALGGAGGIATTLADLAVSTTLILRSVQQIAASYGEDLENPEVRAQCIAVFGMGGPLSEDDAADTGMWAGRIALSHQSVSGVIEAVAPAFGKRIGEGLLARAGPIIGAAAGAAINSAFTRYYQAMAHVHFRLRRIERSHDPQQVLACFERIIHLERERQKEKRKR